MQPMTEDWKAFAEEVLSHVKASGMKYTLGKGLEVAHLLSWQWALGDAFKYLVEVLGWTSDGLENYTHPREMVIENLRKAAHQIQIAATKLRNGHGPVAVRFPQDEKEEKPKPDPPKPDYYGPPEPLK